MENNMNYDITPVNKNATEKAKALLGYLADAAGKSILTGQHTQTNPMEEYQLIHDLTGHYPKVVGFEMLSYSPNINYDDASEECLTEVYENRDTLKTALRIAETTDSILCFCFHWFSPLGGRDKAFYMKNTDFDARKVLIEGTPEREAFYSDLEKIANKEDDLAGFEFAEVIKPEAKEIKEEVKEEAKEEVAADEVAEVKKVSKSRKSTDTTKKKSTSRKTSTKKDSSKVESLKKNINSVELSGLESNNDRILKLASLGFTNKDIAKYLNLGIGEVKLVVDLYKETK
jgi:hypothetical protein